MIAAIISNPTFKHVVVSTGNILNTNNKLGIQSNEELLEGLKLTLQQNNVSTNGGVEINEYGHILRETKELNLKLTENGREEISIGAKIFLNNNSHDSIKKAISSMLEILNVKHVDNVVLAYHPESSKNVNHVTKPTFKWNIENKEEVNQLKQLWTTLEQFAIDKQVTQLGISDLDIKTLEELHTSSRVPPTIVQINLANCCVVPPTLQEFCTTHDIQLLTHSDPEILVIDDDFILPNYKVDWTLRYQVHVRCRGVLTAKGYILGASQILVKPNY